MIIMLHSLGNGYFKPASDLHGAAAIFLKFQEIKQYVDQVIGQVDY
jgi:hypothetical protein